MPGLRVWTRYFRGAHLYEIALGSVDLRRAFMYSFSNQLFLRDLRLLLILCIRSSLQLIFDSIIPASTVQIIFD
jgi:hypothetical protein